MKLVVVGNGILAMMAARAWLERVPGGTVTIVGPRARPGSATRAAAAMLNSFAELEHDSLMTELDRFKFGLSRSATDEWPSLLEEFDDAGVASGLGTYVINNTATDDLDDDNFEAVRRFCDEYGEPYEVLDPAAIPNYRPDPRFRALRALLLIREGWVNPKRFLDALTERVTGSVRATVIDAAVAALREQGGRITAVVTAAGEAVTGDHVLLANGAGISELLDSSLPDLPIQRVFYGVGMTVEIGSAGHMHASCVRTTNRGLACGVYSVPYGGDRTLIGATNYISATPLEYGNVGSAYALLKAGMDQINTEFRRADLVSVNVGWRPTTADTYPLIGPTSVENLWVMTGTKRDGFHLSPVISRDVVSMILGEEADWRYEALRPERPLIRSLTREQAVNRGIRHMMNAARQHDFTPARNRMTEQLESAWRADLESVHDLVGAIDWGIPTELIDMYRYGHVRVQ